MTLNIQRLRPAPAIRFTGLWLLAHPLAYAPLAAAQSQVLASWNDSAARQAVVKFVTEVTTKDAPTFVAPEDRIAVFDNDGTLWAQQPLYFQFVFVLDQVKAAPPQHPEWQKNPAFRALAAKDMKALGALGEKPLLQLLGEANSGVTTAAYDQSIRSWLATARHPKFDRPYTDLVYVPMQELPGPARTRLQDLHRLRREYRVHAALGPEGLRDPA